MHRCSSPEPATCVRFAEKNLVIFFKVNGEGLLWDIIEVIRRDEYEYPIVMPLRLKLLLATKDAVLERTYCTVFFMSLCTK